MKTTISLPTRVSLCFAAIVSLMMLITAVGIERVRFIDQSFSNVSENAVLVQRNTINLCNTLT